MVSEGKGNKSCLCKKTRHFASLQWRFPWYLYHSKLHQFSLTCKEKSLYMQQKVSKFVCKLWSQTPLKWFFFFNQVYIWKVVSTTLKPIELNGDSPENLIFIIIGTFVVKTRTSLRRSQFNHKNYFCFFCNR